MYKCIYVELPNTDGSILELGLRGRGMLEVHYEEWWMIVPNSRGMLTGDKHSEQVSINTYKDRV